MDVDRELEAALAVAPSPEFVARLRAHLAHAPGPADRSLPMMMATGAGLVLMIAIVAQDFSPVRPVVFDRAKGPVPQQSRVVQNTPVAQDFSPVGQSTRPLLSRAPSPVPPVADNLVPPDALIGLEIVSLDASYVLVKRDAASETIVQQMAFEIVPPIASSEGVIQ